MARRGVDLPRQTAYDVLRAVDERDVYVNLYLPGLLRERGLTGRDAAFATELTHGTLRLQGTYDAVIDELVTQDLQSQVRDVLRLGAHQLLSMRVPAHAGVSTTVNLVRRNVGERPARMVNAVLRKIAAQSLEEWVGWLAPRRTDGPAGYLTVARSHPRWIVDAFAEVLTAEGDGQLWEELDAALAADNEPPKVTLVAWPGRSTVTELQSAGASPGLWSELAATLDEGGDPAALDAVREGRAGVQDEGSQLVTLALLNAQVDRPDSRWLDMCAGPGGKAGLLAAFAEQRAADLVAAEFQEHRARLIHRSLRHQGATNAGVLVADGTRPAWPAGVFDRVLVDVPCSGLGALRRRPEARWRRTAQDLGRLVPLQHALLHSALDSCRPGGVVGYATCSPHLAETRSVVAAVLGGRGDTVQEDARELLPGVPDLGPGPHVQLWPHLHGTDAMFLAVLRRRPELTG